MVGLVVFITSHLFRAPKGKCPFGFGSSSKSDGEIPFYDEEGGMHLEGHNENKVLVML